MGIRPLTPGPLGNTVHIPTMQACDIFNTFTALLRIPHLGPNFDLLVQQDQYQFVTASHGLLLSPP